ncbi:MULTISPECIES: aldehyde dehydrogenase family protein [unclassified Brevundimonas]|uniref:aldehyde dehydrogenase family protein n=1 Tax=unclassified Brevundimonas TaxID=2622653 RepID=UPI0025C50261|nr:MULTISPECIES: aldehyde dehydrogenase family protein [unclassified Brevundimonas]
MTDYLPMTVGGVDLDAEKRLQILNPADGSPVGETPDAGEAELETAIAAAQAAFPKWAATPWAERQAAVAAIGQTLLDNADELARMLTREHGKPIDQAAFEINAAGQWCLATSSYADPVTVVEDTPEHRIETHHVPIGVVGAISPWNFPVLLSMWKIGPALLAGNTMVLKPSPFTPMTVLKIGQLLRSVLPAGVLNLITGGDHLGPLMTSHEAFGKISFTGSTATGRKVMQSAAPTLKRLTLELGGNDAAIVFPDVDVRDTAEKLFWSAFTNAGQICVATKRAYVHEEVYDAVRDVMAEMARTLPIGDGSQQGVAFGPVQNRPQYDRVRDLIADSRASGHTVIEGAAPPPGDGLFVPVTLIDNPPESSRIVQEEQFGPVLPLMRFSDENDVIALANASEFGLAATVWTKDEDRAMRVASQLEAGSVWINEGLALSPFAAFAGHKQSGVGQENGLGGLLEYTNPKTVTLRRAPVAA